MLLDSGSLAFLDNPCSDYWKLKNQHGEFRHKYYSGDRKS